MKVAFAFILVEAFTFFVVEVWIEIDSDVSNFKLKKIYKYKVELSLINKKENNEKMF